MALSLKSLNKVPSFLHKMDERQLPACRSFLSSKALNLGMISADDLPCTFVIMASGDPTVLQQCSRDGCPV